jgi:WD40 repeat protein
MEGLPEVPAARELFEDDVNILKSAPTLEVREQIFRRLALRYHPDKATEASEKVEATRTFQRLLKIREEMSESDERIEGGAVGSVDSDCRPPLFVLRQRDIVHGLRFSPSGQTLASCGDSARLKLWDVQTMCPQAELELDGSTGLALTFLSETLLAITTGGCIEVWCLLRGILVYTTKVEDRAMAIAACSYGPLLAAGTEKGDVVIWKWLGDERGLWHSATLKHQPIVNGLSWLFSDQLLAAAGGSRVSIWQQQSAGDWIAYATLECQESPSDIYDIHTVGPYLAVGGTGGTAALWQLGEDGQQRARSLGSAHTSANSWTPRSARYDSDSADYCSLEARVFTAGLDSINSGAQLPQDRKGQSDTATFVLDVHHHEERSIIFEHSNEKQVAVNCVCMSSNARHLASGGTDSRLILWCVSSQEILRVFYHYLPASSCGLCTACVNTLQFAPDDRSLVAGGYDGVITVWRLFWRDSIAEL